MDVTQWMEWFLGCLGRAIDGAQTTLSAVLAKARFWEHVQGIELNDRQRLVINRLLNGFEGNLTTLVRNPGGGRSTSYTLAAPDNLKA